MLLLKPKLSENFQRFNAIDGSTEMLKTVEFPKVSMNVKNFETFYEAQTAVSRSKEIIQPPTK